MKSSFFRILYDIQIRKKGVYWILQGFTEEERERFIYDKTGISGKNGTGEADSGRGYRL
jgi:hypothetical protein